LIDYMNAQPQCERAQNGCGLCGATRTRALYDARDRLGNPDLAFTIAECMGCGVLRTLPEMDERDLERFYPEDYWGAATDPSEEWIKTSQSEKTRFLSKCGLSGGKVLDVGCGSGLFLRALDPRAWDRFGVEVGREASKAAGRALGGERIFNGTLIEAACAASTFDAVTFWSALEHTNDPRANLAEAREIIKKGGTLIVQVPNASSYQARLFGGDWFALDAPRHRYHFNTRTLTRLLKETGFDPYLTTYFSKAHNSHALRQSLKLVWRGPRSSPLSRALFYLSVPFIKPFDWLMTMAAEGATITLAARAV
jgi:2-polyprenyl-3-methyl-5-hydroxy-6-metoxy-1,4-benzoquinol methylase